MKNVWWYQKKKMSAYEDNQAEIDAEISRQPLLSDVEKLVGHVSVIDTPPVSVKNTPCS